MRPILQVVFLLSATLFAPSVRAACSYLGVSGSPVNLKASNSGQYGFTLNFTGAGCNYTVATTDSYITLPTPSGTSTGTTQNVLFQISANPDADARRATISITVDGTPAPAPVDVWQNGAACALNLVPASLNIPNTGGSFTFTGKVTNCAWFNSPTSGASWITNVKIAAPGSTITYSFDAGAGSGAARQGAINFAEPPTSYVINQGAPPALTVAPTRIEQTLVQRSAAYTTELQYTPAPQQYSVQALQQSNWLSFAPLSDHIGVTLDPGTLGPGFYSDTIRVSASGNNVDVPVALTITAAAPLLTIDPRGLYFESRLNQGQPAHQAIFIKTPSTNPVNWTATVISGDPSLVQLLPSTGTATLTGPCELDVKLGANATAAVGVSYVVIKISTPNADPSYVTVVSNVLDTTTPPVPQLSTASFLFVATEGGANPISQGATVSVSQNSPVALAAVASSEPPWLSVTADQTISTSAPGTIVASANIATLRAGVYPGIVNIALGNVIRGLRVLLVVRPSGTQGEAGTRSASGCTAKGVIVTETHLPNAFAQPAGWPQDLIAHLYDDCGTPLTGGTVIASFNNGDAPLRFSNDGSSNDYYATWEPSTANANTTVTLRGSYKSLTPGSVAIPGAVGLNLKTPPSLFESGIIHNAYVVVGAPLAPGNVVQVYGKNLATVTEIPPTPPLPDDYKGTQLLVEGVPAPFYYVSPDVLVAQLPLGLTAGRHPVQVVVNGATSSPISIDITPVRPGVVAFSDGTLIAQHADGYVLVTPDNPARPKENLLMYLVGMGATNELVPTGQPTPLRLVPTTVQPVVTVDGQPIPLQYAGLTPTAIGLYQINFAVPADARSGDLEVTVTQNGVAANTTRLIVRK